MSEERILEAGKTYYVGFENTRMKVLEIVPETKTNSQCIKVKFLDREIEYCKNGDGTNNLDHKSWNKYYKNRMVEDLEGLDLVRCNGDCVNERHLASERTPEFLDENKYPNILI